MNLALRIGLPVLYTGAALVTSPAPFVALFLLDDPDLDPGSILSTNAVLSTAMVPLVCAGGAIYAAAVTPTVIPLVHLAWTWGSLQAHFRQNDIYATLENAKQRTLQTFADSAAAVSSIFAYSSSTSAQLTEPPSAECTAVADDEDDGFVLIGALRRPVNPPLTLEM